MLFHKCLFGHCQRKNITLLRKTEQIKNGTFSGFISNDGRYCYYNFLAFAHQYVQFYLFFLKFLRQYSFTEGSCSQYKEGKVKKI